jgi:hypothetical protein
MTSPTSDTDLWLRLWSWRHRDGAVDSPAPVPEFSDDPWPIAARRVETLPEIPKGLEGPWSRSHGRSVHSVVYRSPLHILRVARSNNSHPMVELEAMALHALSGELVPAVVSQGTGWLLRRGVSGTHPDAFGPWVGEMATFAKRLRTRDLPFLIPSGYPTLTAITELCGRSAAEALDLRPSLLSADLAPCHGDLHAGNLLVNDEGHLSAVLDFESISLAPPERDVAIWILVLAAQAGLESALAATKTLCPGGIRPEVLRAEIVRFLESAALSALNSANPARLRTARYLVERFIEDPDIALRALTSSRYLQQVT